MGEEQLKERLHQFIEQADERTLSLMYTVLLADKDGNLSEDQRVNLMERIKRHQQGETNSYSWVEARKKIASRGRL